MRVDARASNGEQALPPGRWWVAALLGAAVAGWHASRGAGLSHSVLMQTFNWLFDFDTSRFVEAWCKPGVIGMPGVDDIAFVARHALSVPTRALCLAITPFTAGPESALMLLAALCAGACAAVAYALAASFCAEEFDRVLAALAFAVSVQPLMMGVIPETFGFAMLGIGVHLALLARRGDQGLGTGWAAATSLFLNLGFTVTNAVLNIVSAVVMGWQRFSLRAGLLMQARVWLLGTGALLLCVLVSAAVFAPSLLGMAGQAPQKVWWIVNINRGEPASLAMVLCTFFLYSFVAPGLTVLNLPPPDGHPMLDFRHFQYGWTGGLALALWASALLFSIGLAWRGPATRRLLLVAAGWMLCNVVLHWYWQYRGSIYLYGPHTCFALFMVLAIGYGAALRRYPKLRVRAGALALAGLCAANNLGIYAQMIDFMVKQPLASLPALTP